jgi:hypothetical protein
MRSQGVLAGKRCGWSRSLAGQVFFYAVGRIFSSRLLLLVFCWLQRRSAESATASDQAAACYRLELCAYSFLTRLDSTSAHETAVRCGGISSE